MKLPHRRQFLHLAAGTAALPLAPWIASAQSISDETRTIYLGDTQGGAADIIARIIGQWLSARLGQAGVIENRPGAGSNISVQAALGMPADGYTLLLVSHHSGRQRIALRYAPLRLPYAISRPSLCLHRCPMSWS